MPPLAADEGPPVAASGREEEEEEELEEELRCRQCRASSRSSLVLLPHHSPPSRPTLPLLTAALRQARIRPSFGLEQRAGRACLRWEREFVVDRNRALAEVRFRMKKSVEEVLDCSRALLFMSKETVTAFRAAHAPCIDRRTATQREVQMATTFDRRRRAGEKKTAPDGASTTMILLTSLQKPLLSSSMRLARACGYGDPRG